MKSSKKSNYPIKKFINYPTTIHLNQTKTKYLKISKREAFLYNQQEDKPLFCTKMKSNPCPTTHSTIWYSRLIKHRMEFDSLHKEPFTPTIWLRVWWAFRCKSFTKIPNKLIPKMSNKSIWRTTFQFSWHIKKDRNWT